MFYFVYLTLKIGYALALVPAHEWLKLQGVTFTALSLAVLVTQNLGFLLLHRPHRDNIQLLAELSSETCLSVLCVHHCLLLHGRDCVSWLETVCSDCVLVSGVRQRGSWSGVD